MRTHLDARSMDEVANEVADSVADRAGVDLRATMERV